MSGMLARLRKGQAPVAVPVGAEQEVEAPLPESQNLEKSEKTWWQKRSPVIACGAGLFSDGYLNSGIGPVNTILKKIYPTQYANSPAESNISSLAFAGEVLGIIIFGYTADHYSRKWSLFISTIILLIFAALSAGSYGAGGSTGGLFAALTAYRFLLGIGIGGEYPAGSVGCAESTGEIESGKRNRWFIWFTNLQIDIGFVTVYIVSMIVTCITGETHLRAAWRIILGIGCIPPLSLLYMRFKLEEPEAFKREKMTAVRMPWKHIIKFYWWRMCVVSFVWFVYDFNSFAFSIFSTSITDNLLGNDSRTWVSLGWGTLINSFYLPGAMAGSFISDKFGPKNTLVFFATLQAITGFVMAGAYGPLNHPNVVAAFCVVYGLFLSFGEAGPGDNIGLMASKTCATPVRGQYYAVAAGFGKIGAFVGTYAFQSIQDLGHTDTQKGQYPFLVASALTIVAAIVAFFFLPQVGQDTIDLEDRRFRAYLEQQGWSTKRMGSVDGSVAFEATAAADPVQGEKLGQVDSVGGSSGKDSEVKNETVKS